ncbi:MAG: HTTM domain-containing protein, partial [Bacteriovoracaceae bacterium]|nr:HTTM domain-containing protein [Bacteriovoracaceae bacterium]
MKFNTITRQWNNFWFKELPVDGICLFRILIAIVAILSFVQDIGSYNDFWGPKGLQSVYSFRTLFNGNHFNLFHLLEANHSSLIFVISLHSIALLGFLLGYKTRFSSILLIITITSLGQRNIHLQNGADLLLRILLFMMCFAPCANKFSLDAFFAKRQGLALKALHTPWAHRIIQFQIAFVYLSTIYEKTKGSNWLDGSALYYATRLEDFTRFTVPYILDNMLILQLMTWGTLLLELALGSSIFIDEFRKKIIVTGIVFHIGIEYVMSIPTFEILMIACLLAMFKIEDYPVLLKGFNFKWPKFWQPHQNNL